MTESANLQKIRIDEHNGHSVFEKAATELHDCFFVEDETSTSWASTSLAKLGVAKVPWNDDGTGQAAAILWELYITE